MQEWEKRFTEDQLKQVKGQWNAEPPMCCKGKCYISGVLSSYCAGCNWSEDYIPPNEPELI
jgi:hypothetical protein